MKDTRTTGLFVLSHYKKQWGSGLDSAFLWRLFLALPALLCFGCSSDGDDVIPISSGELSNEVVRWDVRSVSGMTASRALIDARDGKTADEVLQEACTPGVGDESIGFWADYTFNGVASYNVFDGTELVYQAKVDGNPYSDWNYPGEDKYWMTGAYYKFRAYYPQRTIRDNVLSTSSATTFVVEEYNTAVMQEDLLLAYTEIDTRTWRLSDPVPLQFNHALAALCFQFRFEAGFEDTDYLTSVWLQNATTRDFSNVGILAYGTEAEPELIDWYEVYQPPSTQRMYYWENEGVMFENQGTSSVMARAYTTAGTLNGAEYAGNDGCILIIPQESDGSVRLCFTTRAGGTMVYSVSLPAKTGTGNEGREFIPGYRYIYTITITKTNLELTLNIRPWNELKSSFDITFE